MYSPVNLGWHGGGAERRLASTVSVLEISAAVRRGRLQLAMPVTQGLADAHLLAELRFEPESAAIAHLTGGLGEDMDGDPTDRLIAATALVLGVPRATADDKLRHSGVAQTVW